MCTALCLSAAWISNAASGQEEQDLWKSLPHFLLPLDTQGQLANKTGQNALQTCYLAQMMKHAKNMTLQANFFKTCFGHSLSTLELHILAPCSQDNASRQPIGMITQFVLAILAVCSLFFDERAFWQHPILKKILADSRLPTQTFLLCGHSSLLCFKDEPHRGASSIAVSKKH